MGLNDAARGLIGKGATPSWSPPDSIGHGAQTVAAQLHDEDACYGCGGPR